MIARRIKSLSLFLGPLLGAVVAWQLRQQGLSSDVAVTALIASWCVIWWVFEPVPIPDMSVRGRNLLDDNHEEFGSKYVGFSPTAVQRGMYAGVTWRF